MFHLVSALTAPNVMLNPLSRGQIAATAGAARGGPAAARVRDNFTIAMEAGHAADIGALATAIGNAREGSSLLQVADRGLDAIDVALTAMKVLAAQASSTTAPLSRRDRAILNAEFQKLRSEIDRIAAETEFKGFQVLKGVTIVEESTETVTQSISIANLGSKIDADDGFQDFVFASNPSGLSDGDRIRIEYDKKTGSFTVTNASTGQVATAAAPASAPPEGQTTEVAVSEFDLTIQLNANFNPNKPNTASPGNPGQNEFVASIATSTTTTSVTSRNVARIDFQVGTGTAGPDKITIVLPAATVADLDSGLASDDIGSASGASQALTNVTNAIDALRKLQASVDGDAVRFQAANRNNTSGRAILKGLKTDRLETPVAIDTADILAKLVSEQYLSHAKPAMAGQISASMRDLLSSARLEPLEPPDGPIDAEAPRGTGTQLGRGFSAYQGVSQNSHGEAHQPVDVTA